MPIYRYCCEACGREHEELRAVEGRHSEVPCECGRGMMFFNPVPTSIGNGRVVKGIADPEGDTTRVSNGPLIEGDGVINISHGYGWKLENLTCVGDGVSDQPFIDIGPSARDVSMAGVRTHNVKNPVRIREEDVPLIVEKRRFLDVLDVIYFIQFSSWSQAAARRELRSVEVFGGTL